MASDLYALNDFLFSDLSQIDLDLSILQIPIEETNNYTNLPCFEVKTEENKFSLSSAFDCDGSENVSKFMQRSFSSNNCFGENKGNYYSFNSNPCFDPLIEFQQQISSSTQNGYSNVGQMRRVFSTGDLQSMKKSETIHELSSSPLGTKSSYIEEANSMKVGRYSAEERKERILRYRAKRTQRNFNKTIKYTCRKTLADNRARIRGRFARNDEPVETIETVTSSSYEEDYNIWIGGFNGEESEGTLFNILGLTNLSTMVIDSRDQNY